MNRGKQGNWEKETATVMKRVETSSVLLLHKGGLFPALSGDLTRIVAVYCPQLSAEHTYYNTLNSQKPIWGHPKIWFHTASVKRIFGNQIYLVCEYWTVLVEPNHIFITLCGRNITAVEESQRLFSASELTSNWMSLSLLEVDFGGEKKR